MRVRLEKGIEALREVSFEVLASHLVCATEGCLTKIQFHDEDRITAISYQRIAFLRDHEQLVYRPVSVHFPMVDFPTSFIKLFNAKSTKIDKKIEVGVDGAREFL